MRGGARKIKKEGGEGYEVERGARPQNSKLFWDGDEGGSSIIRRQSTTTKGR